MQQATFPKPLLKYFLLLWVMLWVGGAGQELKAQHFFLFEDTIKVLKAEGIVLDDDTLADGLSEAVVDSILNLPPSFVPKVSMELLADRLSCIQKQIPLTCNNKVASFIDYFTVRNRNYTQTMLERKDFYFPLFEEALKRHNLPDELKYLAIVESGLNFAAMSRVGAGGLWQFMPVTGREMGLFLDNWFDERLDPVKSTDAACRYLKRLYNILGDWELVLASYNCGVGKVKRIVDSSPKKTFWDIYERLPQETRAYVPQFVAVTYAMNYHKEHNLFADADSLLTISEYDTILVEGHVNLPELARHLGIEYKELRLLNPTFRRHSTPPAGTYVLRIPSEVKQFFVLNREEILDSASVPVSAELLAQTTRRGSKSVQAPGMAKASYKYYKVKPGDGLYAIARKTKTSIEDLINWNQLQGGANVHIGQQLIVGVKHISAKQTLAQKAQHSAKGKGKKFYFVQPGDTLWSISQKIDALSVEDLIRLNNLKGKKLTPGQKLIIG